MICPFVDDTDGMCKYLPELGDDTKGIVHLNNVTDNFIIWAVQGLYISYTMFPIEFPTIHDLNKMQYITKLW